MSPMPELADPSAIAAAVADLGWEHQGDQLVKVHQAASFPAAIAFVDQVAELAERADHHPDIDVRWRTVTLRLSTHSAGGITAADLELAAAIDGLE